jgi:hypothetical protein
VRLPAVHEDCGQAPQWVVEQIVTGKQLAYTYISPELLFFLLEPRALMRRTICWLKNITRGGNQWS